MNWDKLWDALMFGFAMGTLVAPVATFTIWAMATTAVALKWPLWLYYMLLCMPTYLVEIWIAHRLVGSAVREWAKKTLRKPWRPYGP